MKLVNAVLIVDVLIWAVADADVDGVSEWFQSVMSSKSFQTSELQSKIMDLMVHCFLWLLISL